MKGYRYETHLHVKGPSKCGHSTGAELARYLKEEGYQGFVVTDHFFNGNSGVPRDLPWEERIELYCKGYEEAKQEGDRIGIDVFFGVEWQFHNDEYLLYGPDKEWLLSYPDMLSWTHKELFEKINEIGGCIVQAHPFRVRPYIKGIHLHPYHVHGVEVVNSENRAFEDRLAYEYAKAYNLPMTSGSDRHWAWEGSRGDLGIISETKWDSLEDYIRQIKTGSGYTIIETGDNRGLDGTEVPEVPAETLDYEGNPMAETLF